MRLFGDFTVRSQGEDLVGGLVFPAPISEALRLGSPTYQGIEHSLEKDFPDVYRALLEVARDLVGRREHEPQEIEFTFESASADHLYILQKRPMVHEQQDDAPYFDPSSPLFGQPLAVTLRPPQVLPTTTEAAAPAVTAPPRLTSVDSAREARSRVLTVDRDAKLPIRPPALQGPVAPETPPPAQDLPRPSYDQAVAAADQATQPQASPSALGSS